MLFHVHIDVRIPHDADSEKIKQLSEQEHARAQQLQRQGKWLHLWRVAGKYANISVFDVESPGELHEMLSSLPLYPFMEVDVTALCRHPGALQPAEGSKQWPVDSETVTKLKERHFVTDQERTEIAKSFIAAVRAGDARTFQAIMTDDVIWSLPGTSVVSGLANGVDGIVKRAQRLREYGVTLEIQHVVLGYEGVALLLHNTGNRNGQILDEYLTTVCALRDGKIARLDTYISDIPMVDAYFP
jgi:muconolactone delta-isomerase